MLPKHRKRLMLLISMAVLLTLMVPYVAWGQDSGPEFDCKAAVLMEPYTGSFLFEQNPDEPLPIASVTKIMTLVLAIEAVEQGKASLDDIVTASEYAKSMGGSQIWLETGEQMSLEDLLYAIAVGSANDAAVAVAEYLATTEEAFVEQMNAKANELGMTNTVFCNSTGLPPEDVGKTGQPHHASARDVALLSSYAVKMPLLMKMVSTYRYVIRGELVLWNYNRLLDRTSEETGKRYGYPGLDGLKTGMTNEAGYCLAATAERDGLRLIAVVLGAKTAEDRNEIVTRLLDMGFSRYRAHKVADTKTPVGEFPISRGKKPAYPLYVTEDVVVVVPRGEEPDLEVIPEIDSKVRAPLQAGAVVGRLRVLKDGQSLVERPLAVQEDVERAGLWTLFMRSLSRIFGGFRPRTNESPSPAGN